MELRQAAQLTEDAYLSPEKFEEKYKTGNPTRIEFIKASNNPSGYQQFAVKNLDNGKIYIVGKGSDSLRDVREDVDIIRGLESKYFNNSKKFVQEISSREGIAPSDFVFIGHSLAGGISHLDSIEYGAHAISFDAIGIAETANRYFSPQQILQNTPKIVNISVEKGLVHSIYKHLGTQIPLRYDEPDIFREVDDPLGLKKHRIGNIITTIEGNEPTFAQIIEFGSGVRRLEAAIKLKPILPPEQYEKLFGEDSHINIFSRICKNFDETITRIIGISSASTGGAIDLTSSQKFYVTNMCTQFDAARAMLLEQRGLDPINELDTILHRNALLQAGVSLYPFSSIEIAMALSQARDFQKTDFYSSELEMLQHRQNITSEIYSAHGLRGMIARADLKSLLDSLDPSGASNSLPKRLENIFSSIQMKDDDGFVFPSSAKEEQVLSLVHLQAALRTASTGISELTFFSNNPLETTARLGIASTQLGVTPKFGHVPDATTGGLIHKVSLADPRFHAAKKDPSIFTSLVDRMDDPELLTKFVTSTISLTSDRSSLDAYISTHRLPATGGAGGGDAGGAGGGGGVIAEDESGSNFLDVSIEDFTRERETQKDNGELPRLFSLGFAKAGAHSQVKMPISVLNGNGGDNVRPSSIVTDHYRPGAQELSSFKTDKELDHSIFHGSSLSTLARVSDIARIKMGSNDELNIDPVVIDLSLSGRGISLSNWRDNGVLFPMSLVDGAALQQTGWIQDGMGIFVKSDSVSSIADLVTDIEELRTLTSNAAHSVKIWINAKDGIFRPENLKTFAEVNIEEIMWGSLAESGEVIFGNTVKSKAKIKLTDGTTDGTTREIAAIDFAANTSSHMLSDREGGTLVKSKYEGSMIIETDKLVKVGIQNTKHTSRSFILKTKGAEKDLDMMSIDPDIVVGEGSGTIYGHPEKATWLVGSVRNQFQGGSGNDTFVIAQEDGAVFDSTTLHGGKGFNTALLYGSSSLGGVFDMGSTNITVLKTKGSKYIIDARTAKKAVFVEAEDGNNIILGGNVSSALVGGTGDNIIIGGMGGGILRAHGKVNILASQGGDAILETQQGFSYMKGGTGNNLFSVHGGYAICKGGGGLNVLELPGSIYDYSFSWKTSKADEQEYIFVRNKTGSNDIRVAAHSITSFDFSGDVSGYNLGLPLPTKSILTQPAFAGLREFEITVPELLEDNFMANSIAKIAKISGCKIFDATTGREVTPSDDASILVSLSNLKVQLDSPTLAYISYSVTSSTGAATSLTEVSTGRSASALSMVCFRGAPRDVDDYHMDMTSLRDVSQYKGKGIKIYALEPKNPDHNARVISVIKAILPNAEVEFAEYVNGTTMQNPDIINCSFSWLASLPEQHLLDVRGKFQNVFGMLQDGGGSVTRNEFEEFATRGKWPIIVFSSGNHKLMGSDANYCNIKSSPWVIVVGGIMKEGNLGFAETTYKPFGTPGGNILVSAPANYIPTHGVGIANEYGHSFVTPEQLSDGTSFAAPIVSSIIGMMKQVNPALKLPDIKKILAYSATAFGDEAWVTNPAETFNGTGLHYSYNYGFGCVNARNAIALSSTWLDSRIVDSKVMGILSKETAAIKWENSPILSTPPIPYGINSASPRELCSAFMELDIAKTDLMGLQVQFALNKLTQETQGAVILNSKDPLSITMEKIKIMPLSNYFLGSIMPKDSQFSVKVLTNDELKGVEPTTIQTKLNLHFFNSDNITFVFTDEVWKYHPEPTALSGTMKITAVNYRFNTINCAPFSGEVDINLNGSMTLKGDHGQICNYRIEGKFDCAVGGFGKSTITGNDRDNIIIAGKGDSTIALGSGHNIVLCTAGGKNTTVTSGSSADMFIIKKAPGTTIVIKDFKSAPLKTRGDDSVLLSDFVDFIGFDGFDFGNLTKIMKAGNSENTEIELPDDQHVIFEGCAPSALLPQHFLFNEKDYFFDRIEGRHIKKSPALENTLFATNSLFAVEEHLTGLVGAHGGAGAADD